MNILILGSGGREHTLAWKIAQSPSCTNLYVAPGNSGTASIATNLEVGVNDFDSIKNLVLDYSIEMVIVGPEDPLVNGIHDYFISDVDLSKVKVIGPRMAAAKLEGSKEFAKEFMFKHKIPTAKYKSFGRDDLKGAFDFLDSLNPPYVLKADGLAAGKGVLILNDLDDAKMELKNMLINSKFGKASERVVIEEFLDGIELSCFVLTDGNSYMILPSAKDYKRIGEGDVGLNTGGMGAVSPVPFIDNDFMDKVESQIVKPTIDGLKTDGLPYKGFIFIGLIKVNDDPKVIEYNVRMGDPETEVVIPRIKNDFVNLLNATANGELETVQLSIDNRAVATVMLVSGGYPEAYEKGKTISGIEEVSDSIVFHAGATIKNDSLTTNGGRVMAVSSYGKNFKEALKISYKNIEKIHFENMYYRKDIGFDL